MLSDFSSDISIDKSQLADERRTRDDQINQSNSNDRRTMLAPPLRVQGRFVITVSSINIFYTLALSKSAMNVNGLRATR